MNKLMTRGFVLLLSLAVAIVVMLLFMPTVYADTNGTELKITAQPDRLELQLGADWAGAEFELKLDSGVFPVPVVVNDAGVLSMDLGGSKTYTLKLLTAPVPAATPAESTTAPRAEVTEQPETTPAETPDSEPQSERTPSLHLVLFIGGLFAAVGILAYMHIMKKRREYRDDDDDYEYDEDEE